MTLNYEVDTVQQIHGSKVV